DQENNLWVGTSRGGLATVLNKKKFENLQHSLFDPNSLTKSKATALFEDSLGRLWIGYHDEGIDMFSPDGKQKVFVPPEPSRSDRLGAGSIYEILEDRKGEMWIGSS